MTEDLPGDRPSLLIDLGAVQANFCAARSAYAGRSLGAVVKKDAYGLGVERIAPLLHRLGCRDFWVADFDEAVELRRILPEGRIFVLHGLAGRALGDFRAIGAVPVLLDMDEITRAGAATGPRSEAATGPRSEVAIHLDTGINRLGIDLDDVRLLARHPASIAGLSIAAYVTHLARFADPAARQNRWQWLRFRAWTRVLPPAPLSFCASAGVFGPRERHMDLARVGSALYGVETTPARPQPIIPAATLSAPILRVHDVPFGAEIGYGGVYRAPGRRRIAQVAAGYAAGVPFIFRKPWHVLVEGRRAPIVAGTAMSLISVDVTDLPEGLARPGGRVTIFGPDLPVSALAEAAGVAPNVIMVSAGRGVRRVYRDAAPALQPDAAERGAVAPQRRDARIAGAGGEI